MKESHKYELTGKNVADIENSRIPGGYLEEATISFNTNGYKTKISFKHKDKSGKPSIDLSDIKVSVEADNPEQKPAYRIISEIVTSIVGGNDRELGAMDAGPPMTMYAYFRPTKTVTDSKIADMARKIGTYKTLTDVNIDITYADLTKSMIEDSGLSKRAVDELLEQL